MDFCRKSLVWRFEGVAKICSGALCFIIALRSLIIRPNYDKVKTRQNTGNLRDNKAGYTANTSCGRVGRGGNARFLTFQLDHHGPTNRRTDGRTDGQSLL